MASFWMFSYYRVSQKSLVKRKNCTPIVLSPNDLILLLTEKYSKFLFIEHAWNLALSPAMRNYYFFPDTFLFSTRNDGTRLKILENITLFRPVLFDVFQYFVPSATSSWWNWKIPVSKILSKGSSTKYDLWKSY